MTLPDLLTINGIRYARHVQEPMHLVRVLHEKELPASLRTNPVRRPEVRPLFPNHYVPFGQVWQMFAWKLNPFLSAGNMTAVYHTHLWIANHTGFGDIEPRANYFENTNTAAALPRVEALTCGGNILHVIGEVRVKTSTTIQDCYIIETLDVRKPPPALAWIEDHPWLITRAVNLGGADGLTPQRFPQGLTPDGTKPGVCHPLLADPSRYQVVIEKWRVETWMESTPPDYLKLYRV